MRFQSVDPRVRCTNIFLELLRSRCRSLCSSHRQSLRLWFRWRIRSSIGKFRHHCWRSRMRWSRLVDHWVELELLVRLVVELQVAVLMLLVQVCLVQLERLHHRSFRHHHRSFHHLMIQALEVPASPVRILPQLERSLAEGNCCWAAHSSRCWWDTEWTETRNRKSYLDQPFTASSLVSRSSSKGESSLELIHAEWPYTDASLSDQSRIVCQRFEQCCEKY